MLWGLTVKIDGVILALSTKKRALIPLLCTNTSALFYNNCHLKQIPKVNSLSAGQASSIYNQFLIYTSSNRQPSAFW